MKRLIAVFISIILLALPLISTAVAAYKSEATEYFEDGSYLVESTGVIDEEQESADGFFAKIIAFIKRIISLIFKSSAQTVTKTKYVRYYDNKGVLLWAVYLTGEFFFDGKSASCTKADIVCEIYDGDWNEVFATADKDGARAMGSFKIRQQKLGVQLKSVERKILLECDEKGNVK